MRGCSIWQTIRSKLETLRPKARPPIHQHAAVIAVNGKAVAKGVNNDRSTHAGKFCSSTHAEKQAVENWKKLYKGKNMRSLKKIARRSEIYIIRKSKKTGGFCYSSPCRDCSKMLKSFGFKAAIYSLNEGGHKKINLRKMSVQEVTGHQSHAQREIGKHIPVWKKS